MNEYPEDCRFTRDHEWVRAQGDRGTVGITSYAQKQLGDIVYIELPETGKSVKAHEQMGTVESVKAVSELFSPVTGEVVEANAALTKAPEAVNSDPYGQGWMVVEAARAALAGKTLPEVVSLVREMIPVTRMIQTADTLKYLYMGGRIGKAQRLVGTMLNIKPLIGMENGLIVPLGSARSRKRAYQLMVEKVEAVTAADISLLATELIQPQNFRLAIVGPVKESAKLRKLIAAD